MPAMKYEIKYKKGESTISLPKDRLLELLCECSEAELKALIAVAAEADEERAAQISGLEPDELSSALSFWRGAKLIGRPAHKKSASPVTEESARVTQETAQPQRTKAKEKTSEGIDTEELPEYTSADVVRLSRKDALFHSILDEAQRTCGKVFNNTEMNYILAMRDHLGLDGEYILMLLEYYKREGKPLCYSVRVADALVKRGIDTPEGLEEYLKNRDSFKGSEGRYRDLFGIGTRKLTAYEEKYFTTWSEEMKMPFELVTLAFDRTVEKKGSPNKSYMGGILKRWHEAGLMCVDAVMEHEQQTRGSGIASGTGSSAAGAASAGASGESTFNVEDFFQAALDRSFADGGKKE